MYPECYRQMEQCIISFKNPVAIAYCYFSRRSQSVLGVVEQQDSRSQAVLGVVEQPDSRSQAVLGVVEQPDSRFDQICVASFFLIKPADAIIPQIYFVKNIRHWYMSSNLHDIYQCRIYSGKLLMMGRGTARNM
jgi:hypothetical protein